MNSKTEFNKKNFKISKRKRDPNQILITNNKFFTKLLLKEK